jgi:hypothetical protein
MNLGFILLEKEGSAQRGRTWPRNRTLPHPAMFGLMFLWRCPDRALADVKIDQDVSKPALTTIDQSKRADLPVGSCCHYADFRNGLTAAWGGKDPVSCKSGKTRNLPAIDKQCCR